MPNYDYGCTKCGHEFEVSHGMNEKPRIKCPECGSSTKKLISACGFSIHNTRAKNVAQDRFKSETEKRADLRLNYGVEAVSPQPGFTFDDAYRDAKSTGSLVKDQIQQKREENEAKTREKRRKWAVGANKRAPKKSKIMKEKRAEADAAKRAIRLG